MYNVIGASGEPMVHFNIFQLIFICIKAVFLHQKIWKTCSTGPTWQTETGTAQEQI